MNIDNLFREEEQRVFINDYILQSIVNTQIRKYAGVASSNGITIEDLNMFSILELIKYIKKNNIDEFTRKDYNFYESILCRALRNYVNDDYVVRRRDAQGIRRSEYISPLKADNIIINDEGEFESVIESAPPEDVLFTENNFKYYKNPFWDFMNESKNELIPSQIILFELIVEQGKTRKEVSKILNRDIKSINKSLRLINKKMVELYDEEYRNYTNRYITLLRDKDTVLRFLDKLDEIPEDTEKEKQRRYVLNFIKQNQDRNFMDKILMDEMGIYNIDKIKDNNTVILFISKLYEFLDYIEDYPYKYKNNEKKQKKKTKKEEENKRGVKTYKVNTYGVIIPD